jgi:hypothetical protein
MSAASITIVEPSLAQVQQMEIDRRTALTLGVTATAALLLSTTRNASAEDAKEVAPGVHLRVLKEIPANIPGFGKVRWREITWQPGSKFGPNTMKNAMICEITGGPLEQNIEGQPPTTLQPGDTYVCHIGMVETDQNNGTVPSTMRVIDLLPA